MSILGFLNKNKKESLDKGLEKTKSNFLGNLGKALVGKSRIDSSDLDDIEEALIQADIGVSTTVKIIDRLEERVAKEKYLNTSELKTILASEIIEILNENEQQTFKNPFEAVKNSKEKPYVILVVGVNGVGKTTTIGKLAAQFKAQGNKVILGAADTFRAAAVEQLKMWGERVGVDVVEKGMNTDPASVAFETAKQACDQAADVAIIDTAGRLHNKVNLMNELSKIKRVIQKHISTAPNEVLLVLDGSTGQNALLQADAFTKATDVSSMAITKLDGTAKGGVVLGIAEQFKIPVKYIGVGEKVEDLQVFDKDAFVASLLDHN